MVMYPSKREMTFSSSASRRIPSCEPSVGTRSAEIPRQVPHLRGGRLETGLRTGARRIGRTTGQGTVGLDRINDEEHGRDAEFLAALLVPEHRNIVLPRPYHGPDRESDLVSPTQRLASVAFDFASARVWAVRHGQAGPSIGWLVEGRRG
jgi:hypothetical protein